MILAAETMTMTMAMGVMEVTWGRARRRYYEKPEAPLPELSRFPEYSCVLVRESQSLDAEQCFWMTSISIGRRQGVTDATGPTQEDTRTAPRAGL